MFIRVELQNHFKKSISYINPSNILHMSVDKNQVNIYTVFRPKYSAYRIHFNSHEEAVTFADSCFRKKVVPSSSPIAIQKRFDQASPDPLAMQAMADWEEEKHMK